MELFQELLFTISFSLIVSLLIAKLFSIASTSDDGYSFNSTVSKRVVEKIEKDWVFCGEKDEKVVCVEDKVKGDDLGSGVVVKEVGRIGFGDACYVFDEMPERSEVSDDCYVFDEMPERSEVCDGCGDWVGSDEGNVGEGCVKSGEVERGLLVGFGGECYVFDEMPERSEVSDGGVGLVEFDEGNVGEDIVKSGEVERGLSVGFGGECYVFDEMPERIQVDDCVKSVEVERGLSVGGVGEGKVNEEGEVLDDDWQGIETTELDKRFGAAVAFVDSKSGADRVNLVDNEVKVELYGLHKVAIEGSCFEPQPMALRVSARANWNSWKRLENLGREDAMEQYIALLSQHVPDWMGRHASDKQ